VCAPRHTKLERKKGEKKNQCTNILLGTGLAGKIWRDVDFRVDSFIFVTWLIHICNMTHSYTWHDSYTHVMRTLHMPDYMCEWYAPLCLIKCVHNMPDYMCVWPAQSRVPAPAPFVTRMNAPRHTCDWVAFIFVKWLIYMYARVWQDWYMTHTYERVMSHVWMSHVTHMNESCHTYEWVLSHLWMSHVKCRSECCHMYEQGGLV